MCWWYVRIACNCTERFTLFLSRAPTCKFRLISPESAQVQLSSAHLSAAAPTTQHAYIPLTAIPPSTTSISAINNFTSSSSPHILLSPTTFFTFSAKLLYLPDYSGHSESYHRKMTLALCM